MNVFDINLKSVIRNHIVLLLWWIIKEPLQIVLVEELLKFVLMEELLQIVLMEELLKIVLVEERTAANYSYGITAINCFY